MEGRTNERMESLHIEVGTPRKKVCDFFKTFYPLALLAVMGCQVIEKITQQAGIN